MIIPATHIVTPAETTPAPRHIYYPGEHLVSTPQASTHAMECFLPLLVGLLSLLFPSRSWPLSLPRFYRQSLGTIGAEFLHGMGPRCALSDVLDNVAEVAQRIFRQGLILRGLRRYVWRTLGGVGVVCLVAFTSRGCGRYSNITRPQVPRLAAFVFRLGRLSL